MYQKTTVKVTYTFKVQHIISKRALTEISIVWIAYRNKSLPKIGKCCFTLIVIIRELPKSIIVGNRDLLN